MTFIERCPRANAMPVDYSAENEIQIQIGPQIDVAFSIVVSRLIFSGLIPHASPTYAEDMKLAQATVISNHILHYNHGHHSPAMSATWFDHLPQPVSQPVQMSVDELHERMTSKVAGKDFIVVDVRRTDIEVGDLAWLSQCQT
jgi:preprotein translocase subunit Sec61beta